MSDEKTPTVPEVIPAPIVTLDAPQEPGGPLVARNPARELVDAFLRGRNPNTLAAYRKDLGQFTAWLKFPTPEDAAKRLITSTPGDANALVLRYRSAMSERNLSPATINRRLASLRALVQLARMLGMVTWAIEVEGFDAESYRDTRGPGSEAVAKMLAHVAARKDAKGARDVALLRLLHDRVLRRGEIVSLDVEHYDPERGLSLRGKGRRERSWISLPAPAREALDAWLAVRGSTPGPLFIALDDLNRGHRLTGTSIYQIVRAVGTAVGVVARPHGLRHTGITTALDKTNGNVREVQKFSRHRDINTLLKYDDARTNKAGEIAELVSAPSELHRAEDIQIMRGPRGDFAGLSYTIPALDGSAPQFVTVSAGMPWAKKKALDTLSFFRANGMPISDTAYESEPEEVEEAIEEAAEQQPHAARVLESLARMNMIKG